MSIVNLLAQGFDARPAGMQANALMQAEALKARQQQNALMQMQMQDAQAQAADRQRQNALMQQFRDSIPSPEMAASQSALAGGGGPTVANAQRIQPVDPRLQMLHGAMRAGGLSPMDYIKEAMPKDEFVTVAPGSVRVNARTNQPVFTAPKEQKEDGFMALMRAGGIDPASPEGRQMLLDRLRKESTHQPPVSVSYGNPVSGVDEKGNPVFFQPSKSGGAPAIIPGVRPGENKDKDLTEAQGKATTFLGQMRAATAEIKRLGMDQSALSSQAETALAGGPANIAISQKAQQVRQAQDQWSEAYLRFKTGAAATNEEVALNRRTFFPVIGDKPEVIEQKRRMRLQAEKDMEITAGRGVRQLTTPSSGGAGPADDPLGIRGGR